MTSDIASVICGGPGPELPPTPQDDVLDDVLLYENEENTVSPCEAYQALLGQTAADVIIYIHDDVTIHDPEWRERVMGLFENNSECVAVGLGGALALGSRDLYRKPFNIWNMARRGYASNQDDAEVHGERFAGTRRVASIEQFFMAIRTNWLRTRQTQGPAWYVPAQVKAVVECHDVQSGWPTQRLTHHGLDMWLACEAARAGKEIWMTGISCLHSGGGSSTTDKYAKAPWLIGGNMEQDHIQPHRFLYEQYRDVLPVEIIT